MLVYGHGWGKLMHYSERASRFTDPLHVGHERSLMLAVFAEVVCAILVAIGFATRFAAAILAGFFAIILTMVIRGAPFDEKELALFYSCAYLCLMLTGPGAYAVDARFGPRVKFGGGK